MSEKELVIPDGFVNSKRVIGLFRWSVDESVVGAHKVSDLVLRKMEGKWYLAAFVYFFNNKDLDRHEVSRPSEWFLLDLLTGKLVQAYSCERNDFSDARFDMKYSLLFDDSFGAHDMTQEYYREMYRLLDTVRLKLLRNRAKGRFDRATYDEYYRIEKRIQNGMILTIDFLVKNLLPHLNCRNKNSM